MNLRGEQINWTTVVTVLCGSVLAILAGIIVGQHDYYQLTTDLHDYWTMILIVAVISVILYVAFLQHYTWQVALAICYVGIIFRPIGFDFGPMELSCGLGLVFLLVTGWRKTSSSRSLIEEVPGFALFRTVLLVWIVYLGIHLLYNIRDPLRPADFALKNALKSYFTALGPAVVLWFFAKRPGALRVRSNVLRIIAWLLIIGLLFNIAISIYSIIIHHNPVDPDVSDQLPTFFIPVLNTRENPFALRYLGPSAVLLGAVILAIGRTRLQTRRSTDFALFFLGVLGSFLSGGRATVITAGFLTAAVLFVTGRIRAMFIAGLLAILLLAGLNLAAPVINSQAPLAVVRPLQWMLISKNTEAQSSIDSSSRWREELFNMALEEWRSTPRIFWFGRATYGFGVTDFVNAEITGAYRAAMVASLRRGATHNLITDLLVAYGLIGCLLYYALNLAVVRLFWLAYRRSTADLTFRAFTLFCFITYASYIAVASIGGGFAPAEMVWLLIIWMAVLQGKRAEMKLTPLPETGAILPLRAKVMPHR